MSYKRYIDPPFICPNCGKPMEIDDIDVNFDGNQDNYWMCDCGCSLIERVRYGNRLKPKTCDYDDNIHSWNNVPIEKIKILTSKEDIK